MSSNTESSEAVTRALTDISAALDKSHHRAGVESWDIRNGVIRFTGAATVAPEPGLQVHNTPFYDTTARRPRLLLIGRDQRDIANFIAEHRHITQMYDPITVHADLPDRLRGLQADEYLITAAVERHANYLQLRDYARVATHRSP